MSARKTITVTIKDLPLSCPSVRQDLWNLHPRVFLATDKNGECRCPYCGTQYRVARDIKEH